MTLYIAVALVAVACFGYVAWSITTINSKNEKLKRTTQEANEKIKNAQYNSEVLQAYIAENAEMKLNVDKIKKDIAEAENEEDIHNIINSVIANNNSRVQKPADSAD